VYETPDGVIVYQHVGSPICTVVYAFEIQWAAEAVTMEVAWERDLDPHPAATYLSFPFDVSEATPRVDVGDQSMVPGRDQISGTCHDYYTAQRWVDIAGADCGVTVSCPRNPLVQFGEFSFGANRSAPPEDPARLLGWVTNNY
jgi:hypothetical protein